MLSRRRVLAAVFAAALAPAARAADVKLPPGVSVEQPPADPKAAKVVVIAGSNFFKPGEHEYVAGAAVLADLLKQTPGVAPVLAIDWPTKPETLDGAKAVVFFFDGGPKHGVLKGDRLALVRKLAESGTGIVQFHQTADYPKDFGDRARELVGAAWEPGHSQRAHWVAEFKDFPDHPIFRGVNGFKIDDGWLFKLRFPEGNKGVTPLLKTANPKAKDPQPEDDTVVSWAFERPGGGRAFTFTGGHLHASLGQEGYRRFLVNGILWAAGVEVPKGGAPVALADADLNKYLLPAPPKAGK